MGAEGISSILTTRISAFLVAVVVACSPAAPAPARGPADASVIAPRVENGIELRAVLPRDTIAAGDREPLHVLYLVVNGPVPTPFANEPTLYALKILRSDGTLAPFDGSGSPALGSDGNATRLVLPANAILAQVADLRCIDQGSYVSPKQRGECLMRFRLDQPGTYRVVVEYHGLRFAQPEGQMIADTVSLVVVR